jgi:alpha-L-rhamnosidase
MMQASDWQGQWISDNRPKEYRTAPYFRKEILVERKVKSARAYIAAAGLYELSINGNKVGDRLLDPMFTRFDRRNLYASFDVTPYLTEGANVLGVLLGNGWYNHQSMAVWDYETAPWRNRPRFLLNIRITYDDGTIAVVATDETWKTADSPVISNSIYTAEHYDARRELTGWDTFGFDDAAWLNAVARPAPSALLKSQQLHPIRVKSAFIPVKVDKRNDSCYIFHFHINTAGIIDLHVKGEAGVTLRIAHAERLHPDGTLDMSNIDQHYRPTDDSDPFQTDIFILSGKDDDHFSPRFNYKGFQYVEVKASAPIALTEKNIKALELHSDLPSAGTIHSSNPMLNKIWAATNNSYLSNLFGYPTDCPQREKNGWTGDAHIAVETGLYNFDGITVYEKWLDDFRDEQKPSGLLPNIVPTSGWGYHWANGPDWTSSVAIIPWQVYLFYGDTTLLFRMYDNIKRYVNYISTVAPYCTTDWGLGDWVPVNTESNRELTSSLYYYADAMILSKAATLMGKTEDAAYYYALAKLISYTINYKFLNEETGVYCSGSQTEQAAPLYWGIVPPKVREKVACNLYNKVEESGFHLDVGLLGSKYLLNALTENGYADAAYRIASQETFPSWGYWITQGATSLYENWRLDAQNEASFNHIMFGEIGAWMYKGLGGIYPDEQAPGFKNIILRPNFIDGLDHFEASHRSPYGNIVSKWERRGKQILYTVIRPPNSTATLFVPDNVSEHGKQLHLKAGKHFFNYEL